MHIRKFYCTFAPVISPRLGLCLLGGVVADIIRRQNGVPDKTRFMGCLTRFVLGYTNLVNSKSPKTVQHFDVLGICISISVHLNKAWVCACVHIGVGFSVACSGERQYQSQCSGTATVQSRFFYTNAVRLYGSGALYRR